MLLQGFAGYIATVHKFMEIYINMVGGASKLSVANIEFLGTKAVYSLPANVYHLLPTPTFFHL